MPPSLLSQPLSHLSPPLPPRAAMDSPHTKTGLLFCASEFSNHLLYQFQGIDNLEAVSADSLDEEHLDDDDKLGDGPEEAFQVRRR